MIVEGYGSSSEDELEIRNEEAGKNETIEVAAAREDNSSEITSGDRSAGDKQTLMKRQTLSHRKKSRKRKKRNGQDSTSLEYAGPWAKSSESSEMDLEPEEPEREHITLTNSTTVDSPVTTEAYTLEPYMEYTSKHSETKNGNGSLAEFKIPKKVKFTLKGHSKGVTRVRFFPNTGHMFLSSGNDTNIYLWSMETQSMLRGFFGHSQAVKDVVFNSKGDRFLSAGLDKKVLLWDTKTGEIVRQLALTAIPNALIFNPNNENEIVVGLLNRRIEHYDLSQPEYQTPIQIYDHHLGAINSLTVVESKAKFMSTSDDRTIRFWDWQINIPAKIIADPTQHSTPHAAVHPTESFIALQMMDNSIQVIQGSGKFRYNRNKVFEGHRVAGYGIQIAISADGRVLMSGDVSGFVYFWSWKTGRIIKKMKVSDSFISCIDVNPGLIGGIVVAGNKGDIYYCA